MNRRTLTITTKYLDLILSGEKKVEYRKDIPFYHKVLKPSPDQILFHNRHGRWLLCDIKRIRNIGRPKKLEKSEFITTDRCFAIEISSARLLAESPQNGG